jgi:hypothetical protein
MEHYRIATVKTFKEVAETFKLSTLRNRFVKFVETCHCNTCISKAYVKTRRTCDSTSKLFSRRNKNK